MTNTKILTFSKPKRGDIVVFDWPVNKRVNFVKRVIGLPGDKINYVNNILSINGEVIPQKFVSYAMDANDSTHSWPIKVMKENLVGIKHKIYLCALWPLPKGKG